MIFKVGTTTKSPFSMSNSENLEKNFYLIIDIK